MAKVTKERKNLKKKEKLQKNILNISVKRKKKEK